MECLGAEVLPHPSAVCPNGFVLPTPVPPMFQKVGAASAPFEFLSREEEARGGVTEYREIVENNPVYLYCDTNAVPPPELTWYWEDQPLSATDGVSVLQGRSGLRREVGAFMGSDQGHTHIRAGPQDRLPTSPLSSPVCCVLCGPGQGP